MSCEDVTIIVEETAENIEFQCTETVENVTVVISESAGVSKHSELNLDDGTNPHGTTKADVGLGNVPNLDTTNAFNNEHTHTNKSILDQITEAFTTAVKTTYDNAVSSLNVLLSTGQRLINSTEIIKLSNTSGTNTGDQDLSGLMVKSNNLSDVQSVSTARNNLGLGTLSTQNGTFSGSSSGTNTGDETTLSIQTKRPLKTVDNQSLEGSGNITTTIKLTKVEILSSALTTQDKSGFLAYINSVTPFSIASNERVRYVVTDTGYIFDIEVNNRNVGSGQTSLTSSQVSEVGRKHQKTFHLNWNGVISFQANTNYSIMGNSVGTWYFGFGTVQNGTTRSASNRSGAVCVPFKTKINSVTARLTHANNATQGVEIIVQKFTQGQASPINVVDLAVLDLTTVFFLSANAGSNASIPSNLISLNTSQQVQANEAITIIARNKTGTASFACAVDILMEFKEVI